MQHGKRRDVERHGYAAWPEVFEMAKSKSNVGGGAVRSTLMSLAYEGCWNPDMQWDERRKWGGVVECVAGDANAGVRYANASSSVHKCKTTSCE
jgi:hypothetical protein